MLHLFRPPYSQSSGTDIFGQKTIDAFRCGGVSVSGKDLWPDSLAAVLNSGRVPMGRRAFRTIFAPIFAGRHVRAVNKNDSVWILGSLVPLTTDPLHEQAMKRKGASYIYHVIDNWLDIEFLRKGVLNRCQLADCLIVPTPQLLEVVRTNGIRKPVLHLEEPIDVDRLSPRQVEEDGRTPFLVWCGNPNNIRNLEALLPILNALYSSIPFRLRVISNGRRTSTFSFRGPVEWLPYDYQREPEYLSGAAAGLAPLEDSSYNRCKGAYKIKTYMAAGVPVVASRVGYQENLLKDGIAGRLVQSEKEWLDALFCLLNDQQYRKETAQHARQAAIEKYSHKAVIPRWIEEMTPYLST